MFLRTMAPKSVQYESQAFVIHILENQMASNGHELDVYRCIQPIFGEIHMNVFVFVGLNVFRFVVGPVPKARPQTLYDKIWADHLVHEAGGKGTTAMSNSTHERATRMCNISS